MCLDANKNICTRRVNIFFFGCFAHCGTRDCRIEKSLFYPAKPYRLWTFPLIEPLVCIIAIIEHDISADYRHTDAAPKVSAINKSYLELETALCGHILAKGRRATVHNREVLMNSTVPIWEKANLTVEEATAYFNIGVNKIRELSNPADCPFVLWVGSKRLIKRKAFENFLTGAYSI